MEKLTTNPEGGAQITSSVDRMLLCLLPSHPVSIKAIISLLFWELKTYRQGAVHICSNVCVGWVWTWRPEASHSQASSLPQDGPGTGYRGTWPAASMISTSGPWSLRMKHCTNARPPKPVSDHALPNCMC